MVSMLLLLLSLSINCRSMLRGTCSSANAMGTHNYIGECAIGISILYKYIFIGYTFVAIVHTPVSACVWEKRKISIETSFEVKGKTELALQLHFYYFQFSFLMCVMYWWPACVCVCVLDRRTGCSFEGARARARIHHIVSVCVSVCASMFSNLQ